MAAPENRPCEPWEPLLPVEADEVARLAYETTQPAMYAELAMAATDYLWSRSGRRYGLCTVSIRPCGTRTPCPDPNLWDIAIWPWIWRSPCGCTGRCSRGGSALALPRPVASVTEVLIDGAALDPSEYRIDKWRWLIRTDGTDWPATQDLTLPPTEADTFQVTFERGRPIPALGRLAMGALLLEFIRGATDPSTCRLPATTKQVTRRGVTTVMDPKMLDYTGLSEVRQFLTTKNPYGIQQRARVYRADA